MATRRTKPAKPPEKTVICSSCGRPFIISVSSNRKKCSPRCTPIDSEVRKCIYCDQTFVVKTISPVMFCDILCPKRTVVTNCISCGVVMARHLSDGPAVFCSNICSSAGGAVEAGIINDRYSPKRRAVVNAGDSINRMDVFEFYRWTCILCDGKIDSNKRFPNPGAATIEHIVPISKLGTHVWENVAPAHAKCNAKKYDKVDKGLTFKLNRALFNNGIFS